MNTNKTTLTLFNSDLTKFCLFSFSNVCHPACHSFVQKPVKLHNFSFVLDHHQNHHLKKYKKKVCRLHHYIPMPCILNRNYFRIIHHCRQNYSTNKSNSNLINLLKSMPKSNKHVAEVQLQRIKMKEKLSKFVPGRVTLQVLGSGAKGAPCSLYVFSDQSRYLFNCGEGTQRLAHEHKMKLAKLEHIFITHPIWKNMGGLPGTALTIQDVGVPKITLHGPQGLDALFKATKRFVIIKHMNIRMAECNSEEPFEDNVMKVFYVPLRKNSTAEADEINHEDSDEMSITEEVQTVSTEEKGVNTSGNNRRSRRNSWQNSIEDVDTTDYYAHERKSSSKRRRNRRSRSRTASRNRDLSQTPPPSLLDVKPVKEEGISMAYICKLQPRPGALDLDKCVRHGVPPGPLLGRLKSGQDVILDSGVIVKSKDVCEPDDPGPVFIVIECPSEAYLDSLLTNEDFKKHQNGAEKEDDVACVVVHFTPKEVVEDERYKEWVRRFPATTQHIVINESNTSAGSVAVHKIQHQLNILHQEIFPLLHDSCKTNTGVNKRLKVDTETLRTDDNVQFDAPNKEELFHSSSTLCSYHLRPRKGLDNEFEIKISPDEYVEECLNLVGFSEALTELKENLSRKSKHLNVRPYPKILFLGTGSCIPNKTRNVSGILLETSENNNIIVDCGEGTYGQLIRFFGSNADRVLANVNAIYISHLHADHHIGLVGFLQGRRKALHNLNLKKNPVLLFAPKQILTWLNFYDKIFESVCKEFELIPNCSLLLNNNTIAEGIKIRILNTLELQDINTVYVRHCPNAFGVSFTHNSGYKVTYSGDTMPCDDLVELGQNSDLLIHEATMEDELAQEAVVKMHSTTSQAIEIGKQMHAKHILLTHFSQRYSKLPRFNDNFTDNVGIAFDNMQIKMDELPLVPLLYPALRMMFAEHYEEIENKAVKRQRRIERQREESLTRS